ncbi:ribose 5-phosphate isomerase B [Telmatocola sphagniphila]|uniref:Ribose 5-phosphate isomerase B n=1 Tax=Telmatocola sphagniphila TaxID=1123043 RepID=A0A8E6EWR1_9BACT|nr:ribose 5-phosphate isomerase B [Telmatocola sphagniphila]QVL34225.1 ribose 5-phosphate isomerase B [Telmatocola sphagniphila]
MKIALANDHRGVAMKQRLLNWLRDQGHQISDLGANTPDVSVDYPDYAFVVAEGVSKGEYDRGILICGTGVGMCIAANKVFNVRAACCHDPITAELCRRHNDANVICLSADLLGEDGAERILSIFLSTEFEQGRHLRRIDKIASFEAKTSSS